MRPPIAPEIERTKQQPWLRGSLAPVVSITSKPHVFGDRKRGRSSLVEMRAWIASNAPRLIEDVELDIVSAWRRGVQIAYLAKMYQLTVRQVEAVIWLRLHPAPPPTEPVIPTVRESRGPHLVVARKAA